MAGLNLHLVILFLAVFAISVASADHGGGRKGYDKNRHGGRHHDSSEEWDNWHDSDSQEWDDWHGSKEHHHGSKEHHHDHHRGRHHGRHWWKSPHGVGAIIGIVLGSIAILTVFGCVVRKCCNKKRKDRVADYRLAKVGGKNTFPPSWSSSLIYKPELGAGFGDISDGFMRIGSSQIVRSRPGTNQTDGAKWAVGMTKGKHLFEVTWRWGSRGNHATIGLATEDAPLTGKGDAPLVGGNPQSWGLDIVKRKTLHRNTTIVNCPTDGSYVPDKFLMYVDMDEGTIGYGNDVTYWGEVVVGLPNQGEPLYLMIGATKWQSEISVTYLGSAPEGDEEKAGMKPPHHLPPLFHVAAANPTPPPTYTEMNEKNGPPADLTEMAMAPPMESNDVLPPPYSHPPVGNDGEKY